RITINGVETDVADYYLPIERAEFIRAYDPLALVPEHFGSATGTLSSQKSTVRISDIRASDERQSYALADWTITSCIDDGAGNLDHRYGWRSDGTSLIHSVGHDDDVSLSTRTAGTHFTLTAP